MLLFPSFGISKHENDFHHGPFQAFYKTNEAGTAGQGVCLVPDHTTSTDGEKSGDRWGKRDKIVDAPDKTNAPFFAGVIAHDFDAKTGGRWITINVPGSTTLIQVSESVSIGDKVCCMVNHSNSADNGKFSKTLGFEGRGMAVVMEDGNADDLVMAKLLDGPVCGVVEIEEFADDGSTNGFTKEGLTFIKAHTISSNATYTLADGDYYGQKKAFQLDSSGLTTSDFVITVTNGIQADDSTALVSITMDGANDLSVLEWLGDKWKLLHNTGSALAAT